jgi:hypothetical protein
MKPWIILAVIAVVLSAAGTAAVQYLPASSSIGGPPTFPNAPPPKPRTGLEPKAVVLGEPTFEFGTLPQRHTGKHSWTVKNEGKGDLDLWMISSTCSCTLAKFKDGGKAVVKPGESTEITLEFETRDNNGDYKKGAEIGTSDPDLSSFSLYVHGMVHPAITLVPAGGVVNMLNISTDKEDHFAHVALFSQDRPDVKVTKVTTSKPGVELASVEPLAPDECDQLRIQKGLKLNINVKSALPLGTFREEVVLATDHPSEPEVRLTVTGKMSGPVNVIPEKLRMHQVNGKAGGRSDITISVRGGHEAKISVEKTPKGLDVEVGPTNPPRKGMYRLSVIIPRGTPAADIEDEIVLKTDIPKAEKLIVPVSIWVQSIP